jgi:uncharacterized protein YjbI with pentapeptide repeats
MPNIEHLEVVLQGSAAIAAWRRANPSVALDLGPEIQGDAEFSASATFEGVDLTSATALAGADLSGADLRGAQLQDVDLRRADLSGARLNLAHLEGAVLDGALLDGADLSEAFLDGAKLRVPLDEHPTTGRPSSLADSNLSNSFLRNADLFGARLEGACLIGADLTGAKLGNATLLGADLQLANLAGTNLERANLGRTSIKDARMDSQTSFEGARLDGAILSGSDIRGVSIPAASKDRWSVLRRGYTGSAMTFTLIFVLLFFLPYGARLVVWLTVAEFGSRIAGAVTQGSAIEADGYPVWQLVIGWDRGPAYGATALILISYNAFRFGMTRWLCQVRENEERSGRLPKWREIAPCWHIHFWILRFAFWISVLSFVVHAATWATAVVDVPFRGS